MYIKYADKFDAFFTMPVRMDLCLLGFVFALHLRRVRSNVKSRIHMYHTHQPRRVYRSELMKIMDVYYEFLVKRWIYDAQ